MFSQDSSIESNQKSIAITDKVVEVYENISNNQLEKEEKTKITNNLNYFIRKCAHFTVYLILGILVYLCFLEYNFSQRKLIIISIIFCLLYALFDELHQLFINGRSGKLIDVAIDTLGSITGIIFTKFYQKTIKPNLFKS